MRLPANFTGRVFAVLVATIALYTILGLLTGWDDFYAHMAAFPKLFLVPLVFLSLANYGLRYWRWELYLRELQIALPRRESLVLFFATFVMVITPGKIGEAFKAGILKERFQVPLAKGLPVILAERLFDFLAIFLLALTGLLFWTGPVAGSKVFLITAALLPLCIIALRSQLVQQWLLNRASRAPYFKRYRFGLEEALQSLGLLLKSRISTWSLVLSTSAWAAECVSLWVVCQAIQAPVRFLESFFVYATGTLVGSLTFLPGGLGGTEFTIIGLLKVQGLPTETAVVIALVVRVLTLWLAVAIGLVVFGCNRGMFLHNANSGKED